MNLEEAKCVDVNPEIFFPEGKNKIKKEYIAKQICASCPITKDCLEFAINNSQLGIWGGTTEEERRHINIVIK